MHILINISEPDERVFAEKSVDVSKRLIIQTRVRKVIVYIVNSTVFQNILMLLPRVRYASRRRLGVRNRQ